ncbi:period circadian protein isoform X2 [Macrosteles quadrilineatus]|uniref:period circadian protein isoform X2 n=1 Tax=Macrosteles quadrilineatus TaxID=74068 RepID=UPI0023E30357|nr:period circadian protein isoform X2 [Macrosteles quadrilineatus]
MAANISENEETETNKTKVSDSGYSNSCSNSQSQRSNSSKSRHSTSSGSSGYCGHPSSSGDESLKNKKSKVNTIADMAEHDEETATTETAFTPPHPADAEKPETKKIAPCVDPAVLDNMSSPTIESEALQVAVVAQTLCCIKTKTTEQPLDDQEMATPQPVPLKELQSSELIISALKEDIKHEKEFCVVVSLSDGTVVCTSPNLTNVLGFPKDMWVGRSLINFLHPKDRIPFASHITSAMAHSHFKQNNSRTPYTPQGLNISQQMSPSKISQQIKDSELELQNLDMSSSEKGDESEYFYCWIRKYSSLMTSGFKVADKKSTYLPCQLSMTFKEVPEQGVFLVATAHIVNPSYKVPDEAFCNPPTFTIRHTANTLISHVDNEVVHHFGYVPHDMIGRSIFDFYYTEDLPYLKDVYTNVLMEEGQLFTSRPYKFRCQNGDCVMVETEWSSFINPWGKKLEFIIGRHRVLTGPHNPDVVTPVLDPEPVVKSEEEQNECKTYQEEIKVLLIEPIVRCFEPSRKQLAQLVESLEKISSDQVNVKDALSSAPVAVPSVSIKAASEMLGEISPHHVYSDKSSSDTPSYNQLTYNENIQRFFASEPKTIGSEESRDTKTDQNQSSSSGGEEGKSLPNNSSFNSNSDSCLNGSGNGSGSGLSSNSARLKPNNSSNNKPNNNSNNKPNNNGNNKPSNNSNNKLNNNSNNKPNNNSNNKPPVETNAKKPLTAEEYDSRPLTEEMLYKHNENMNKQMAQKHKKEKNKGGNNRKHKNIRHKILEENEQDDQGGHGMKRSVSHSWEGEPLKAFKGGHRDRSNIAQEGARIRPPALPVVPPPEWTVPPPIQQIPTGHIPLVNPIMQLPCVYMNTLPTTLPTTTPMTVSGHHELPRGPAGVRASEHPRPTLRPQVQVAAAPPYLAHPVQYMPSLMYQLPLVPMVYTQSHIIQPTIKPRMAYIPNISMATVPVQQPSSRATSVKGETGSTMYASASLKQAMSDSSKKENKSRASSPVYSPGGFTSQTGKSKTGTFDHDLTHDDTSYCSYSSLFLKTEKSDDSMKGSQEKETGEEYKNWRNSEQRSTGKTPKTVRKEPSWMENVEVTPDLMLRYQLGGSILSQVLQSDFETLLKYNQPELVNEQLDQLYVDLEGLSKKLTLEENFPSSCSSSDEKPIPAPGMPSTSSSFIKTKKKKKFINHDKCAMIFEEYAPLPPSANELLAMSAQSS